MPIPESIRYPLGIPRKNFSRTDWRKHYCIIPRRINGKWYWREYVYRKFTLRPDNSVWQYGDEFDILKEK